MLYLKFKKLYFCARLSQCSLSPSHTHTPPPLSSQSSRPPHFQKDVTGKSEGFSLFFPFSLSLTFNLGLVLEQWGLFKIHHICVDFHYRPLKMYLFFLWVTVWIFCIWQDSIFLLVFKSIVLIMQALLNRQILLLRWNYFFFNFNYSCLLDYWICSLEALYADKR